MVVQPVAQKHRGLFKQKIGRVVIMGGIEEDGGEAPSTALSGRVARSSVVNKLRFFGIKNIPVSRSYRSGQAHLPQVARSEEGYMMPDKAQNNTFDWDAAVHLYKTLQEENIPVTVVSRWAAYAAKLPLTIYDRMAATGPQW